MASVVHQLGGDLAALAGEVSETVTVTAYGKPVSVTVKPFNIRQLAKVLKCVQRMRDAGAIEPEAFDRLRAAENAQEAKRGFDLLKMFLAGSEEIVNILQIATAGQLKAEVVDRLSPVEGARVAAAVLSVNVDFFYQNREVLQEAFAPALKVIENVADKGLEALGQPPSTDSSEPDTP